MMVWSGFLASLAAVLAATLLPWSNFVGHSHWAQVQWIPFYGRRLDWFEIAANGALFVPLGYFAGGFLAVNLPGKKPLWVLVGATLLSTIGRIYTNLLARAISIGHRHRLQRRWRGAWPGDFSPALVSSLEYRAPGAASPGGERPLSQLTVRELSVRFGRPRKKYLNRCMM